MAGARGFRSRLWASICAALLLAAARASPNHDDVQARQVVRRAWQQYSPVKADAQPKRRVQRRLVGAPDEETRDVCESVAQRPWEPLRIGYEFLDAENVRQDMREHIEQRILAPAIGYWSRALRVHRVTAPLRAEYVGEFCEKYGLAVGGRVIASEQEYTCQSAQQPMCGPNGHAIPAKYLRRKRVCSRRCPGPVESLAHLINVDQACDNCTDMPEGPGAVDVDFLVLVTVTDELCEGEVRAHATSCVRDQCDRPIFGLINFCRSKVSLDEADVDQQVSTAVHELAHALAFSAHHFVYFRHADGTPRVPRDAEDASIPRDVTMWSCSYTPEEGGRFMFPDAHGDRAYVDLSRNGILGKFGERGLDNCPCPIGQDEMLPGCLLSPQSAVQSPRCALRVTTPMVTLKTREFFDCDTLPGAELENQPSSSCTIVGSHWEQRVFMGEVMAPAQVLTPLFVSSVTLALFQDSGWYMPDYNMSDRLVKGVHWGYKQGCHFAVNRCIQDGETDFPRFWCTDPGATSCSLDRTAEVQCAMSKPPSGSELPPALRYSRERILGSEAFADYCPIYFVTIMNHVCTDASADTFPYSNVNFERELFGPSSRCLESNLAGDVGTQRGEFQAPTDKFGTPKPRCYEVRCKGSSYEVWMSDLHGSSVNLGECLEVEVGQSLSGQGFGMSGAVMCAPFAELCGVHRAEHLGPVAVQAQVWPPPPAPARLSAQFEGGPVAAGDVASVNAKDLTSQPGALVAAALLCFALVSLVGFGLRLPRRDCPRGLVVWTPLLTEDDAGAHDRTHPLA